VAIAQVEASGDYNPGPNLEKIRAPLLAINSADDLINPPELGILEREIKRVPNGRAVVMSVERQNSRARQSHRRDVVEGPARETAQRDGKMSGGSISVGVRSAINNCNTDSTDNNPAHNKCCSGTPGV